MTELDQKIEPVEQVKTKPTPQIKGDLISPEWAEPAPWFGYIGVGIAIAAMLLGIGGMILAVRFAIHWANN